MGSSRASPKRGVNAEGTSWKHNNVTGKDNNVTKRGVIYPQGGYEKGKGTSSRTGRITKVGGEVVE